MPRLEKESLDTLLDLIATFGDDMPASSQRHITRCLKGIESGKMDDDPGDFNPIDVCADCYAQMNTDDDCEHPTYIYEEYTCFVCGEDLGDDDD